MWSQYMPYGPISLVVAVLLIILLRVILAGSFITVIFLSILFEEFSNYENVYIKIEIKHISP